MSLPQLPDTPICPIAWFKGKIVTYLNIFNCDSNWKQKIFQEIMN